MKRSEKRAAANRALHWNRKLAEAQTPEQRATVWLNLARSAAARAEREGDTSVWDALAEVAQEFHTRHGT
ncbi:hypothetical protein [Embleya sp. NPDC059237]|uniref:hypothetical protein n=1 Tax=Embleya sp. NPDC059237 TaxID=3346784 RepID=UPI003687CDCE